MSRVPEQAMAFSQRDDTHNVNITSVWTADDPDPNRHIDWARRFSDALTPLSHERVYVNFLGNEVTDRVQSAYGEPNYHRLATIKAAWDPTNFRGNHNITPLSA
jgi:hypothetical protein